MGIAAGGDAHPETCEDEVGARVARYRSTTVADVLAKFGEV